MGREDRLVRGGVAFSLLLMAVFAVASSGGIGVISALFVILGLYFGWTAATGGDPVYARYGIDTRTDDVEEAPSERVSFVELQRIGSASASASASDEHAERNG